MKKFISNFAIIVLLLLRISILSNAQNYNPIIPDMIADPSICEFDGTFYCYATTDGYDKGLTSSGPLVAWKSKDFVNWSFNGTLFPSSNGQVCWAPGVVHKVNGKYYFYPTINSDIYAAVADSPEGPFRLASGVDSFKSLNTPKPLIMQKGPKGTKGLDGQVFIDNNGQAYIYWAKHGAAKLNADMVSLDTNTVVISTRRKDYSLGPFLFKRKDIYYYMYTLSGQEMYHYAYVMGKTSPLGPFEFPEEDIISTTNYQEQIFGPGHGCVFNPSGTDDYYFVYLEFGRGGTTRQVWANKMEFNDDGTIKPVVLTNKGVGPLKALPQQKNIPIVSAEASSVLPDLKVKPIRDTALHRIETFKPSNVFDFNNGTRWMAAETDTSAWVTVDLGKTQKIVRSDVFFVKPTAGHAYVLEYSNDAKKWKTCGGHPKKQIQSPHSDMLNLNARYLKIKIIFGVSGIWEWKVY